MNFGAVVTQTSPRASPQDGGVNSANDVCGAERGMSASRMDSEEVAVSQLLQSLRSETQQVERLQAELLASATRYCTRPVPLVEQFVLLRLHF